jgi:hypothetical protein
VEMKKPNPWYKEPWPWFFLAPITASMIVGFSMLGVAIDTNDGLVTDDYYRQGVLYNENLERDVNAKELGITGSLTMDELTGDVLLTIDFGQAEPSATIDGAFRSPTRARDDILFKLEAVKPGFYLASIPSMAPGPRNLELVAPDNSWRITSRVLLPLKEPLSVAP